MNDNKNITKEAKDVFVKFRTTREERNALNNLAKERGFKSLADYLKYCIVKESNTDIIKVTNTLKNK